MKQAKRHHCRHNASIQWSIHQVSVFWRRVHGIYGADHREFDRKHPDLELAVDGMKQRIAAAQAGIQAPAL